MAIYEIHIDQKQTGSLWSFNVFRLEKLLQSP